jgi:pimeloyl-ACP methyl ester carboxylesterase
MVDISIDVRGVGKPLVLLHAFPLSRKLWSQLEPPDGFQLVLPDFPGFGSSPLAPSGLTMMETAQSLQKHLKEKGITGPIALGGISMGGYWALEFLR